MLKILFLAPQPFYQERGTPIAIDLALRVLDEQGHSIDLLTYPEGDTLKYDKVNHVRVPAIPAVRNVPPGFSWKKILYSFLMFLTAIRLCASKKYDVVHAVEDACFIALLLKLIFRVPYIYDMDSSIARQMIEKVPFLKSVSRIFNWFEGLAIRHATAVIAVCPALFDLAKEHGATNVLLLQDISLLDRYSAGNEITDIKGAFPSEAPLILYVGNLEHYQGIDLLVDGFSLAQERGVSSQLAVIGGRQEDIRNYQKKIDALKLNGKVILFGPRPLHDLGAYLKQADILASPRIQGNNTPMKIYTYLDAGKAILATDIQSHTQALDDKVACLVEPSAEGVAEGIRTLVSDSACRKKLGENAHELARERHCWPIFRQILAEFYRSLDLKGVS